MLVRELAMSKVMIVFYFAIYLAIQTVDAQSPQPPKPEKGPPPKVPPKPRKSPQGASLSSASSENVSQEQRIPESGSTEKPISGTLRRRGAFRPISSQEREERLCLLEQVIERERKELELQAALLDFDDTAQEFGINPIKGQTVEMTNVIRKSADAVKKVLEEIHKTRSNVTKPLSENPESQESASTEVIYSHKSAIQKIPGSKNAPKPNFRAIRKVSFSEPAKDQHGAEALQVFQEAAIPQNSEKQRAVKRIGRVLTAARLADRYDEAHKQLGKSEESFNRRQQLAVERKKFLVSMTANNVSEAPDVSSSRSEIFPGTSRLYVRSSENLYEAERQTIPESQEEVEELARSKSLEDLHLGRPTTKESTVQGAQAKKSDLVIYHIGTF